MRDGERRERKKEGGGGGRERKRDHGGLMLVKGVGWHRGGCAVSRVAAST